MRKLLLFFVLLVSFIGVTAQVEAPRSIKWERIHTWKNKTVKAYVDSSSIKLVKDEGDDYSFGMVLFYRDNPVEFDVHTESVTANIFAGYFAANCTDNKLATVSEFYFNLNRLPNIMDEPLRAFDYSDDIHEVHGVSKDDPILNALCIKYI